MNLEVSSGGSRRSKYCDRSNVHHNGSDRNYNPADADCWIVNHMVITRKAARLPVFNELKKYARRSAGTSTLIQNWYLRNDSSDKFVIAH